MLIAIRYPESLITLTQIALEDGGIELKPL